MADKKMVEAITSMEEDFAQWYTDVVKKAELIDYTSVKGCMVLKPAGYAIWELIQKSLVHIRRTQLRLLRSRKLRRDDHISACRHCLLMQKV